MITIRGAITIERDIREEVLENTCQLLSEIIQANKLDRDRITAIFFSCTKDISSVYPAVAARELGFIDISLMCFQEMFVENSLEKCIRVCLFYDVNMDKAGIRHIYLKDAAKLRPDLIKS